MVESKLQPATIARRILRRVPKGALGTLDRETGAPYVSFVPVGLMVDGTPLLLLSRLSDHTRNLDADPRVSLMVEATGESEVPSDGARVTLQGSIAPAAAPASRRRYLARHPYAELYAGFADFAFFRIAGSHAHLIQGFGNARWIRADEMLPPAPALADGEEALMTALQAELPSGWAVAGIDTDGADLRCGERFRRLWLDTPSDDPGAMLEALRPGLADLAEDRVTGKD